MNLPAYYDPFPRRTSPRDVLPTFDGMLVLLSCLAVGHDPDLLTWSSIDAEVPTDAANAADTKDTAVQGVTRQRRDGQQQGQSDHGDNAPTADEAVATLASTVDEAVAKAASMSDKDVAMIASRADKAVAETASTA